MKKVATMKLLLVFGLVLELLIPFTVVHARQDSIILWSKAISNLEGGLISPDGSWLVLYHPGTIEAYDISGDFLWKKSLWREDQWVGPKVSFWGSERLVLAAADGSIMVVDKDGKTAWQRNIPGIDPIEVKVSPDLFAVSILCYRRDIVGQHPPIKDTLPSEVFIFDQQGNELSFMEAEYIYHVELGPKGETMVISMYENGYEKVVVWDGNNRKLELYKRESPYREENDLQIKALFENNLVAVWRFSEERKLGLLNLTDGKVIAFESFSSIYNLTSALLSDQGGNIYIGGADEKSNLLMKINRLNSDKNIIRFPEKEERKLVIGALDWSSDNNILLLINKINVKVREYIIELASLNLRSGEIQTILNVDGYAGKLDLNSNGTKGILVTNRSAYILDLTGY